MQNFTLHKFSKTFYEITRDGKWYIFPLPVTLENSARPFSFLAYDFREILNRSSIFPKFTCIFIHTRYTRASRGVHPLSAAHSHINSKFSLVLGTSVTLLDVSAREKCRYEDTNPQVLSEKVYASRVLQALASKLAAPSGMNSRQISLYRP